MLQLVITCTDIHPLKLGPCTASNVLEAGEERRAWDVFLELIKTMVFLLVL